MNKFIIKTFLFSLAIMIVFYVVCLQVDGFTDPFYIRFTTPKQNSLIIGTSKAAQGIQPEVLEPILQKEIFNYAFSVNHSPFGETYFKSIKRKIKKNSEDGIFIVAVDPWSISSLTENPEDASSFRELDLALSNTPLVNLNPNPLYLINNWNENYYKLISTKSSQLFLHDDGWLEVNIKLDSVRAAKSVINKEQKYRKEMLPGAKFSKTRFESLKETIKFLNNHGDVYLVRLPIHPKMMAIENELMPDFTGYINEILGLTSGFLDLTPDNTKFDYTDGNHLYKASGKLVSERIGNWIREQNEDPTKLD